MKLPYHPILFLFCFLCKLSFTQVTKLEIFYLWKSDECKNEIDNLCKNDKEKTNSQILNCLQSSNDIVKSISNKCQNYLWNLKNQYLKLDYFNEITKQECENDLKNLSPCEEFDEKERVLCLIRHKSKIKSPICASNVREVAAILFSDISVIHKFIGKCAENVKQLSCGRLDPDLSQFSTDNFISRVSSQSSTIECLIGSLNQVSQDCRKQILRLGELQSDDFHLNPTLYFSCRLERELLCDSVAAGRSRVYRCLEKNREDSRMSEQCRRALELKHRLEFQDYKIRAQFSDKCAKFISVHQCVIPRKESEFTDLLTIVFCLLEPKHQMSLSKSCQDEVLTARTELAQSNELTSMILKNCKTELKSYCTNLSKEDTNTSCLMRNAMPALENKYHPDCIRSLKNYIKIINPAETAIELDPIIGQSCSAEIAKFCNSESIKIPGDRYNCLLGLLDEDKGETNIFEHCKTNLIALAQFINSENSVNYKFISICHKDAMDVCKVNFDKNDVSKIETQAAIHCLMRKWNDRYVHKEEHQISDLCVQEIKEIIQLEASNVLLNFDIYTSCYLDLNKYCTGKHKMDCLQLNYRNLSNHCRTAISNFLSLDAEEYSLNKLIARSCSLMVKRFCSEDGITKKNDYMECLLRNKFDKKMDKNCRIAIEHYQIIELDNYKISHKFARFCSNEIKQFCSHLLSKSQKNGIKTDISVGETKNSSQVSKSEIVACLSKKLTLNLIKNINPFSAQCYEQFTFEFLQQTNSINVDPELKLMCELDIKNWCSGQNPDEVLTCLHRYQDSLSEKCSNLLFSRQQLSALDTRFDVGIQRYCQNMIMNYCKTVPGYQVFRCLHKQMRIEGFDSQCKKRIKRRLERRLVDIRLNPELIDDCGAEIKAMCNVPKIEGRVSEMEYKDKYHIIKCLRNVYVEHRKFLGGKCRRLVYDIILDANSDIHLDPELYSVCQDDIKRKCSESLAQNSTEVGGRVQDCLKHTLLEGNLHNEKCFKEVYRLLREGRADIHVDPQLYSACQSEISRICQSELLGHGRKLSCLLWALENKNTVSFISQGCKSVLQERKEMWEFASRIETPENLKQIFQMVSESDSRYYFYSAFFLCLGLVLLIGILFGKRLGSALNRSNKYTRIRR